MARGGAQLQQVSGNLRPPLSLAWPQFPLWFMQLCFYLAWLKAGGVGGAAFQGRSKARFFSGLPDLSCLEEEVLHGTPLGNLVAALPQPEPSTSQSLLHCEWATDPHPQPRARPPQKGNSSPTPASPSPNPPSAATLTSYFLLPLLSATSRQQRRVTCKYPVLELPPESVGLLPTPPQPGPFPCLGVWERKED